MPELLNRLQRLWRPREPLFWLVVALNGFSSVMTTALLVLQPEGWLRAVLAVLALLNTVLGMLLLLRLWQSTSEPDKSRLSAPGDHR